MADADARYTAPPNAISWAETLGGTLVVPIIGLIFHRADPLFLGSGFSWLIFAPLLLGIRYGFAHGFASALLTAVFMFFDWRYAVMAPSGYPFQYALSVVLVGMLAGQFADVWLRRLQQMQIFNDYATERLATFRRSYQLLKVSHDEMTERLASDTYNPRAALEALRQRFVAAHDPEILAHQAQTILEFLSTHSALQQASLYAIGAEGKVADSPLASVGAAVACPASHPMLCRCLEHKTLVSVRYGDTAVLDRRDRQGLLAVAPLVDVRGRIWAVVAIAAMPFMQFHERNLGLLALLCANLGDAILRATQRIAATDPAEDGQALRQELELWSGYAKRYRVSAMLVGIRLAPDVSANEAQHRADEWLIDQVRGLDVVQCFKNRKGGKSLLILMPMTDSHGVSGYRRRIERMLETRLGATPGESVLAIHQLAVSGEDAAKLYAQMCRECDVASA